METKILEDLGFSNAEIKVYMALLELGLATAGPIIEKSGLQSSVVHMTLNKLVGKGLVSSIKQGKRNHYQAANPQHISEYIDEKRRQYEQLLPELLLKQNLAKQRSEVTTFRGIKGIRELLHELLEAGGKEHHTFGSSKESLMMGDAFWLNYHKKRSSKGIKAKLLFNESLRRWCNTNLYPKAEYKFTKIGFEPLTETIIREDKIGIILWTEQPIGILIENKVAAESYDQFWRVMWESN
ncbi:BlaI/MecI/CopY family transcriptional regulator [Candidatus Woesearchaeota archaeon]|nr:BlaI/MecI/CopY family transcriptional regulator [Candidatus Woesearchaeota archaeon]